jgi:hypothetical protein
VGEGGLGVAWGGGGVEGERMGFSMCVKQVESGGGGVDVQIAVIIAGFCALVSVRAGRV